MLIYQIIPCVKTSQFRGKLNDILNNNTNLKFVSFSIERKSVSYDYHCIFKERETE